MTVVEKIEKQMETLFAKIKQLEADSNKKDSVIHELSKSVRRLEVDSNNQRKKMKSEMSRLESKIR